MTLTETINDNLVVSMNYTLKDKTGNVIDASSEEPLAYLHGHQNIIPGLERALTGLKIGDNKQVTVPPGEAYGDYNASLKTVIEADQFQAGETPQVGMIVHFNTENGPLAARILKVDGNDVEIDFNHPLAGETLYFDVTITGIRSASDEELTHGHPHGPGGHHHH